MRRLLLALAALVALAGCEAELTIDVAVEPDGSGTVTVTVTVDDAAVAEVPELAGGLRVDDLAAAGWVLERPAVASGAVLVATKGFGSADALAEVLTEIDGTEGIIIGSALTIAQGVDERTYDLSVTVDPRRELDDLSDPEVTALLDGSALGRDIDELGEVDLSMTLRLSVPGAEPVQRRFLADDSPAEVVASGTVVDAVALELRDDAEQRRSQARTVALGLAAAWVLLLLWWLVSRRRRRRRRLRSAGGAPAGFDPSTPPDPVTVTSANPSPGQSPRPAPQADEIEVATGEWRPR